jgi:hypothetical protein
MCLFFALAAALGLLVTIADKTNAYQQSPPLTKKCYLEINDAYHLWYRKCFGKDIDLKMYVIPVGKAIQGHLEAGVLWEKIIVGILQGPELKFKLMTHEMNLYHGMIDGELILICHQVVGFVDAAHAADIKTRRSITGLVFQLTGSAIAYKSKIQVMVVTSSTEAKFAVAIHAAKIAKYLCFILEELSFAEKDPMPLYMDNQAAIAMINENKLTQHSRHIDIQLFVIQECVCINLLSCVTFLVL